MGRNSFILEIIDFSYKPPIKSTSNISHITIKFNASFFPVHIFPSINPFLLRDNILFSIKGVYACNSDGFNAVISSVKIIL
jgi:hypothetical protein